MSRVFETPREGLICDVHGGSVPNALLYRIQQIEGLSNIKLICCWLGFYITMPVLTSFVEILGHQTQPS